MKRAFLILASMLLIGCTVSNKEQKSQTGCVRHVILWTLSDELTAQQKTDILEDLSCDVKQLEKIVPGAVSFNVLYNVRLESSNCDFMFDFVFQDAKSLEDFASNPDHLASAARIKPYITGRTCLDLEIPAD